MCSVLRTYELENTRCINQCVHIGTVGSLGRQGHGPVYTLTRTSVHRPHGSALSLVPHAVLPCDAAKRLSYAAAPATAMHSPGGGGGPRSQNRWALAVIHAGAGSRWVCGRAGSDFRLQSWRPTGFEHHRPWHLAGGLLYARMYLALFNHVG